MRGKTHSSLRFAAVLLLAGLVVLVLITSTPKAEETTAPVTPSAAAETPTVSAATKPAFGVLCASTPINSSGYLLTFKGQDGLPFSAVAPPYMAQSMPLESYYVLAYTVNASGMRQLFNFYELKPGDPADCSGLR